MPFDSSGPQLLDYAPTVVNPLARMGIVPIPRDFVLQYKKDYRATWAQANPHGAPRGWRTIKHNPKTRTLQDFMQRPMATRIYASDGTSVPRALADLALAVHEEEPEAMFSIDFFDVDPVLQVSINGVKSCLGIWDNGRLIHIAART